MGAPLTTRFVSPAAFPYTYLGDHAGLRLALLRLVESDGHIKMVGQSRNGVEGVSLARTLRPDVILMDIAMPVLNGLEATRQILAANPAAKVALQRLAGCSETRGCWGKRPISAEPHSA